MLHVTSAGLKEFAILTALDDLPCRLLEAIELPAIGPRNVDDVNEYPNPAFFEMGRGAQRHHTAQHTTVVQIKRKLPKRGSVATAHKQAPRRKTQQCPHLLCSKRYRCLYWTPVQQIGVQFVRRLATRHLRSRPTGSLSIAAIPLAAPSALYPLPSCVCAPNSQQCLR